jgi:chromosomal replication initiation ATPase DnaA
MQVRAVDDSRRVGVQSRLRLEQAQPRDRASFIPSASNLEARAALDAWPNWPGAKLVLVGPEGSGKTHLGCAWADRVGAQVLDWRSLRGAAIALGRPVLVEDVERLPADETLLRLIDQAEPATSLLLTARTAPRAWATQLPDLRSRLNALMVAELQGPDDVVLEGLLGRFFRERNIRASKSVLDYLVRRIERSAPAARDVVARIDEAAAAQGRNITRDLAREVLGEAANDPSRPQT